MDQSVLLIAAVIVIILISFIVGRAKKAKLRAQIAEVISNGRYTVGQIVAVLASSEATSTASVYLSYRDPTTGNSQLVRHQINLNAENVPLSIRTTCSCIADLGDVRRNFSEMTAHRKELESQGYYKDEVDEMMMNLAEERSTLTVGGPDKYGFVKLAEPVDVDVYLHDLAPTRDGIHVVFKRSSERVS